MRTAIGVTTALGLILLGFAVSGISAIGADLERAAPARERAPLIEEVRFQTREVDCPLVRERPRQL